MDDRRSLLLIGEDANTLRERLRVEGYDVLAAGRGERALEAVSRARVDCLIFDLAAGGRHGFDVCRELRASGSLVPIVFLTRRNRPMDGVIGLRLGADDYVRKPVALEELLARLEAVLRRSSARPVTPDYVHASRGLLVNFRTAEVARDGVPVCLSALELQLLRYLIEHRGEALTRDELLDKVWGSFQHSGIRSLEFT